LAKSASQFYCVWQLGEKHQWWCDPIKQVVCSKVAKQYRTKRRQIGDFFSWSSTESHNPQGGGGGGGGGGCCNHDWEMFTIAQPADFIFSGQEGILHGSSHYLCVVLDKTQQLMNECHQYCSEQEC